MDRPSDMTGQGQTLAELRLLLAPAIAQDAAFDGWSAAALEHAAAAHGLTCESAALAYPGGAMDMIDAWFETIDAAMAHALPADRLAGLSIREKIARLVRFRLDAMASKRESLRRAQSIMAMPQNLVRSARIGWRSADRMWRLAGDTAVDYNHYTKRAMLAAIYAATLSVFVADDSDGHAETLAFLDRRIAGVMRFEKARARLTANADHHFSPARFLGRLRYPAR